VTAYYTESSYDRLPDDGYATIDDRCWLALRQAWEIPMPALDPCTRTTGTALDGVLAGEMDGVLWPHIKSVVTNPPYRRPDVDDIAERLIQHVRQGDIDLAAILVRSAWDCAKSRSHYWHKPFAGSVRLQFRPVWFEDRRASPIHNFQWLIWDRRHRVVPVIRFAGADL
jgi:hypothetical protein